MRSSSVPAALSTRLGYDATEGIVELLDTTKSEIVNDVLSIAAERFERRVTQEVAALRVDFTRELHEGLAGVRGELHQARQDFTEELAAVRVEFIKWSFAFWIAQVAVVAGLLLGFLRYFQVS